MFTAAIVKEPWSFYIVLAVLEYFEDDETVLLDVIRTRDNWPTRIIRHRSEVEVNV